MWPAGRDRVVHCSLGLDVCREGDGLDGLIDLLVVAFDPGNM